VIQRVLDGQAIVITGAGRGLGAAYAELAAAHGASVVVNDIDAEAANAVASAIAGAGGVAVAHAADVADWDAADRIVDACVTEFGAIHGLINNAGVMFPGDSGDDEPEAVRQTLLTNVQGTIACGAAAIRRMRAQGHGVVLNDTTGAAAGASRLATYGASKAAVLSLTISWAIDLQGAGIRVNAIAPMATTRVWDPRLIPDIDNRLNLERLLPEHNAPLAIYLMSPAAHGLHGQIMAIRGGGLSFMHAPGILAPVLDDAEWSVESIDAAMREGLAEHARPLGLRRSYLVSADSEGLAFQE